ncbi:hypothetical protein [Modestobacter sp. SYSU DS0290]
MTRRRLIVLGSALLFGWTVLVAVVVLLVTDWSSTTTTVVTGLIAGAGTAPLVLWVQRRAALIPRSAEPPAPRGPVGRG